MSHEPVNVMLVGVQAIAADPPAGMTCVAMDVINDVVDVSSARPVAGTVAASISLDSVVLAHMLPDGQAKVLGRVLLTNDGDSTSFQQLTHGGQDSVAIQCLYELARGSVRVAPP